MVYARKIRHYITRMNAVMIGVYDARVPEEWIEQDLLKAGVAL